MDDFVWGKKKWHRKHRRWKSSITEWLCCFLLCCEKRRMYAVSLWMSCHDGKKTRVTTPVIRWIHQFSCHVHCIIFLLSMLLSIDKGDCDLCAVWVISHRTRQEIVWDDLCSHMRHTFQDKREAITVAFTLQSCKWRVKELEEKMRNMSVHESSWHEKRLLRRWQHHILLLSKTTFNLLNILSSMKLKHETFTKAQSLLNHLLKHSQRQEIHCCCLFVINLRHSTRLCFLYSADFFPFLIPFVLIPFCGLCFDTTHTQTLLPKIPDYVLFFSPWYLSSSLSSSCHFPSSSVSR